ncbi:MULTISPECIES: substrate-binding periplasmic protein [Paraburkholderia]|uniref:Amino acid ABC transporter substrate-binding protein n=1 Tax=Paraburkholderia podalyriae TaxID=1938811 RepID=A0ABR7PZJ0_9BURK|nr:transporter substrate-binding domain-containing protein [Paraburkholderia podalyriae]MBC8751677.1 amino acid ABC transporter substrate-binding protein [Paraburkholderia podalyriae]
MSKLFATCVGMVVVASASAQTCKPLHKFDTINPGVLTVSATVYPPFDNVDKDGKFVGVDADILRKVGEKECLQVNATSADSSASIQYVLSGKADVSSSAWYRTADRAKVMGVSNPVYTDLVGIFSREGYTKFSQLDGKKVGTVQGYLWVSDLKSLYGDKLNLYPNAVALIQDLQTGRIDAAVNGYVQANIASKNGEMPGMKVLPAEPDKRVKSSVLPAQSGFLYTKSNTGLGDALNADIADMQKNGELIEILKAHGVDSSVAKVGEARYVQ